MALGAGNSIVHANRGSDKITEFDRNCHTTVLGY
jgi:hypothetical protein